MADIEFFFKNKDRDNFYEDIRKNIKEFLPEEYKNAEIRLDETIKANDTKLMGMTIRIPEATTGPRIYLDEYYREYLEGMTIKDIMKGIADTVTSCEVPKFNQEKILNYEVAKQYLKIQMCDVELNRNILKDRPHTIKGDFACIYKINLGADRNGLMNVPINNSLLDIWNIDIKQLHEDALKSPKENNYKLTCMNDIMAEMMGMIDQAPDLLNQDEIEINKEQADMFVLTNDIKCDGAAALVNKEVMERVGNVLGNCYIIPSSVHEVILIPDNGEINADALETMISEVNTEEVAPEEILSYKAQYYDAGNKVLENAKVHGNPTKKLWDKGKRHNFDR